jgi:hypothetical protein
VFLGEFPRSIAVGEGIDSRPWPARCNFFWQEARQDMEYNFYGPAALSGHLADRAKSGCERIPSNRGAG